MSHLIYKRVLGVLMMSLVIAGGFLGWENLSHKTVPVAAAVAVSASATNAN